MFEDIKHYLQNKRKILKEKYGMPIPWTITEYVKYTKIINFLGLKIKIPEKTLFRIIFRGTDEKGKIELDCKEEGNLNFRSIVYNGGLRADVDPRVFPGVVKFLNNLEKIYLEQEEKEKKEKQRKIEDIKRKEKYLLSKLRGNDD